MWFFFAAASAVLYSFRSILEKKTLRQSNKFVLGLAIRLFALPFFIIPFFIKPELWIPLQNLDSNFWVPLLFICCIFTPFETIFYLQALKDEEVSLVLPILSLAPSLTIIFAALVLREVPSLGGILGVILIVLGIYALKLKHVKKGFLEPILHLKRNKAVNYMFLVMISLALSSVFDKLALQHSNVYMYAFANYLGICISLFIIAYFNAKQHLSQLFSSALRFAPIGMVVAAYTIFNYLALETSLASYVSAIRASSILLSILWGVLLLKEKDKKEKIFGGSLIAVGLIILKLFG